MQFKSAEEMEAYFNEMREAFSRETEQKREAETWYASAIEAWKMREIGKRMAAVAAAVDAEIRAAESAPAAPAQKSARAARVTSATDTERLAKGRARSTHYNARLRGLVTADFDSWYTAERKSEFEARAAKDILAAQSAPAPVTFANA